MPDTVDNVTTVEVVEVAVPEIVVEEVETVQVIDSALPELVVETAIAVEVLEVDVPEIVVENVQAIEVLTEGTQGPPGPPGPPGPSEEDVVYTKRIDMVSDTVIYKGEAEVGSSESALVWRIRKIVIALDGDVTETWASGTAAFQFAWSNHLTLTYS